MRSRLKSALSFFIMAALLINAGTALCGEESTKMQKPKITLDIIHAYDSRLPQLSAEEMRDTLTEAKRIIIAKFGDDIDIEFHDNGVVSLDDFFKSIDYVAGENEDSKKFRTWKADLSAGPDIPIYTDKQAEAHAKDFIRQWSLDSLKGFFPGTEIKDYDDAFNALAGTYKKKIEWLKTLKTADGSPLLMQPPRPWQSYVEWMSLMRQQDKYDVIFTNTLIVYDFTVNPYPHTVLKHAKVGGSSFTSPKRVLLDGNSLMVNIIEDYGNIEGISIDTSDIPPSLKAKILGGFYFAHEFGHAFFQIPDVYDHGDQCVMNSSLESLDSASGYKLLIQSDKPCPKCRPWVQSKAYVIKARAAYDAGRYDKAGSLYEMAIAKMPMNMDMGYEHYSKYLMTLACDAYGKSGSEAGLAKCRAMKIEPQNK